MTDWVLRHDNQQVPIWSRYYW